MKADFKIVILLLVICYECQSTPLFDALKGLGEIHGDLHSGIAKVNEHGSMGHGNHGKRSVPEGFRSPATNTIRPYYADNRPRNSDGPLGSRPLP